MMYSAFVNINDVPTMVACWGKWVEESFKETDCKHIVLMIVGNPGVAAYYYTFLETVHERTGYNVWVLSHAGHEFLEEPSYDDALPLYTLQDQIDAKIEFVRQYVPSDCHLHLVGHSIGAYMCCQLLKEEDLNKVITKSYLLFPTIERMASTPNGRFYTNIVQHVEPLIMIVSLILSYFPNFLRLLLIRWFSYLMGYSRESCDATLTLVKPAVLHNVFFLVNDELMRVRERDEAVVKFKDKLIIYYGAKDGWAPKKFLKDLKKDAPDIKAEIDSHGFEHAYVMKYSTEMALVLSDWILEN